MSEGGQWESPLPERYRLERKLGSGGGGQVWAALDLATGRRVALKGLLEASGSAEAMALVSETSALSGLEGLGFPRVLGVGRAPDGRPYLVRELVAGQSLEELVKKDPGRALGLLPLVAEKLTIVHRAGFLHGDVKPANVVALEGALGVALLDLGLAVRFADGGDFAKGLTPHYAAPEVLRGAVLTPQGEVHCLGVMVRDFLAALAAEERPKGLEEVIARACAERLDARYPSADEFASALRRILGTSAAPKERELLPWPVVGLDGAAFGLRTALEQLKPGGVLCLLGEEGSGRSTLLSRVAWELGQGPGLVVVLDEALLGAGARGLLVGEQLIARAAVPGGLIAIDGDAAQFRHLEGPIGQALRAGARVLQLGREPASAWAPSEVANFAMPPLDPASQKKLLRRALPALPDSMLPVLREVLGSTPGKLRRFVELAGERVLITTDDILAVWDGRPSSVPPPGGRESRETALLAAEQALERGRYLEVRPHLDQADPVLPRTLWLEARYELATGSAERAADFCRQGLKAADLPEPLEQCFRVTLGRALLGSGHLSEALEVLSEVESYRASARAEGLAYRGLTESLLGHHDRAAEWMAEALVQGENVGPRLRGLIESCHATTEWRAGRAAAATAAYERAIQFATEAGDAGMLTSAQINLAGLCKTLGDLARSIELLERALDSAQRAGRLASVQQALLNLANADLYLGRLERARASLTRLRSIGDLSMAQRAQVFGLEADLEARLGQVPEAVQSYRRCEESWREQGRGADAAEAALEAVLVMFSGGGGTGNYAPTPSEVAAHIERGKAALGAEVSPLLFLAEARALSAAGEAERAEAKAEEARKLAEERGQREWAWRAHALEAELLEAAGRHTRAKRARSLAFEILEEIGARLPGDLREVYWNEPRRRSLRDEMTADAGGSVLRAGRDGQATQLLGGHFSGTDAVSRLSSTPLERRMAKILAINSDLAAEATFEQLATKIVLHATELLGAERGYLLLGSEPSELTIAASRGPQGAPHQEFSRSVAAEVLRRGEPLLSVDAGSDPRLRQFESVHAARLAAVACVPILSPSREVMGAIYIETRFGAGLPFREELPTLQAFADQAAIAIASRRLIAELSEKTRALQERNERLAETQAALKEVLSARTERLRDARRQLQRVQETLTPTARPGGLVGESAAMRRVYALLERVRDTDIPVLITGESGTGKEVIARAIHEGSRRCRGQMLAVNCGAIPESILESELFGHVRGAFTGADRDRKGVFQEAKGGSLFLDEIGETPLKMQAGLLRVLQESRVRPVGSSQEVPVDVRLMFATNRDLNEAVANGTFREDLFYRIQVVQIELPPLRERLDDIPLLVDHFLARFALRFSTPKRQLSREGLARLMSYAWPGNVRQLENTLMNAWVLSDGDLIEAVDINLPVEPSLRPERPREMAERMPQVLPKKGTLSEHQREEKKRMIEALEKAGWNRVKAAQIVGMPRRTFYRRLAEYGLQ